MAIQAQLYSENLGFSLGGGSPEWVDNNGCGGGLNGSSFFTSQQHHQYMQQLQNQQEQIQSQRNYQNFFFDSNLVNKNNTPNYGLSQSFASQFDNQRQEIDQFISLQSERLRLVLQEQRKQQLAALLRKVESKVLTLLRQKDEEIEKATNRAMELEDFLRKLEMENQAWQRVAKENEAKVMSLNHTIEQIREKAYLGLLAEDAESCCDDNIGNIEGTGENRGTGEEVEEDDCTSNMVCRGCNSRNSCVLLLPCRHFCSCKDCESFFHHCPVCQGEKKGWIEARIF